MDDKGDPVIDHPDEQNEKSRFPQSSELFYLPVELDYLVDCAMEEAEAVLYGVHEHWPSFLALFDGFLERDELRVVRK